MKEISNRKHKEKNDVKKVTKNMFFFFFFISLIFSNTNTNETENIQEESLNSNFTSDSNELTELLNKHNIKRNKFREIHRKHTNRDIDDQDDENVNNIPKQNLRKRNYLPKFYPNAIDENGTITCKAGYIGDDPIQNRGCWKCSSKCHPLASCQYPGFCNCPPGYEGNGISTCNVPTPYPYEYSTIDGKEDGKTYVNVTFTGVNEVYNATEMFCKINDDIIKSSSFTHDYVLCEYNKRLSSGTKISLSFNNNDWGEPLVISSSLQTYIFYGFALIAGAIIGISAFVMLLTTKPGPTARREEMKPLKTDMNRDDFEDEDGNV